MRRVRVIPTLLIDSSGGLVKTIKFGKRTYIGDPINAVKIFNEKEVDELLLLDIDASREQRPPQLELIEDIVSEAFMPVGYGGGVTSIDQMTSLFRSGVEKVVISTAAYANPQLITEASNRFGNQSVVVCLDVTSTITGGRRLTSASGTRKEAVAPLEWAKNACDLGAGELIVNAVHRDGTFKGYDIPILHRLSSAVTVPVVACGGASGTDDFLPALEAGCSAVAAGSIFVYQGREKGILISYPGAVFSPSTSDS